MLQEKLRKIEENIDEHLLEKFFLTSFEDELNFVLDIEACKIKDDEMLTYSIALMNCNDNRDICYNYRKIEDCLSDLINLKATKINIYIHNLYYDFKPFLTCWVEKFNSTPNEDKIETKKEFNGLTRKYEYLNFIETNKDDKNKPSFSYDVLFKKGQLYQATFYTTPRENKKGIEVNQRIIFKDTLKVIPYSLKKASKDFLDLELSKQGLDYEKKRSLKDEFTKEEKFYIYEDVFALKYLVKKLIIDGFNIGNKFVRFDKLTNSSQSLFDYKLTLLDDFYNKKNVFNDFEYFNEIDTILMRTNFHKSNTKEHIKADLLFKAIFPQLNYFVDGYLRHSYYGGLSMVDFNNVKRYEKDDNKRGLVFDVNSLYPYIMKSRLLPVGNGVFKRTPYKEQNDLYKSCYPLYVQEIFISDMKLKEGKVAFVQVKDRSDFNGREVIEENINLLGEKVEIRLLLCNPLLELLFENYDVTGYELGSHIAYRGKKHLFDNYLDFWGEVKKTSTGCNRAISKLRQNALYGKFGTSCDGELVTITSDNGKWTVINNHVNYVTDNIYLPMATFITSYAKQYLVQGINANRERFLYCDTDSLHLFGDLNQVQGLFIDSKVYGAWKHELTFNDFKYLGPKRYAEKDVESGKWKICCCGLTSEIMNSIDDIEVFDICPHTPKEINKMKMYTNKVDNYYYYDKECTKKIKGVFKSKKAKIIKNGTSIEISPYMITPNPFRL